MYPSTSVNGLNGNEKKFMFLNNNSESSSPTPSVNHTSSSEKKTQSIFNKTSNGVTSKYLNNNNSKSKSSGEMAPSHHGKRKKQDSKTGKGLRHFSMKVCEKVRNKGTTTYNEVADELVAEFSADPIASRASFQTGNDQEPFDQKNIRRRVYDALNVLMAINIISKEKKEIKWIGLPTNAVQECSEHERERQQRLDRIKKKKKQLRDIMIQQIAFKNLVERNQRNENPDPNTIIKLPFIIINTDKNTVVDCGISANKSEYVFKFGSTFEIHDDFEIMKRLGLAYHLERLENGQTLNGSDYERARQFLPEALRPEFDEMIEEKHVQLLN